jgi:hypothetical protein
MLTPSLHTAPISPQFSTANRLTAGARLDDMTPTELHAMRERRRLRSRRETPPAAPRSWCLRHKA